MNILFEPMRIGKMEIRNRFVRSATYDGSADRTGTVSEKQMALCAKLVDNGVGLLITGVAYVHKSGQISGFQNSLAIDEVIPSFIMLAETVHRGGGRVAVQLFHAGRERGKFTRLKGDAMGPSVIEHDPYFGALSRAMEEGEIWEIIEAFGNAARRARESGCDAVQVHGAHAYLLAQFLSPYANRRKDQWGGSLENRLRLFTVRFIGTSGQRSEAISPCCSSSGLRTDSPGDSRLKRERRPPISLPSADMMLWK